MSNQTLVKLLLEAPDTQLDASQKPKIEKWSDPPTPIEILEVLDACIYGSLASGVVVGTLQIMYKQACEEFKTTHEEVIKQAAWRNR